jgi:hypothetical protein
MKRTGLALLAMTVLLSAHDENLVAGSKWKKMATCAAPYSAGCSGCYGPAVCSGPGCFGPGCFGPGCFAPDGGRCFGPGCGGCFAPGCGGCFAPGCSGGFCSQPGCFAPGCGTPFFAPSFGCGGCACGQPFPGNGYAPPPFGGVPVIGSDHGGGPVVGGLSLTPVYHAPVAPMTFTVPAIPPAEDIAW